MGFNSPLAFVQPLDLRASHWEYGKSDRIFGLSGPKSLKTDQLRAKSDKWGPGIGPRKMHWRQLGQNCFLYFGLRSTVAQSLAVTASFSFHAKPCSEYHSIKTLSHSLFCLSDDSLTISLFSSC